MDTLPLFDRFISFYWEMYTHNTQINLFVWQHTANSSVIIRCIETHPPCKLFISQYSLASGFLCATWWNTTIFANTHHVSTMQTKVIKRCETPDFLLDWNIKSYSHIVRSFTWVAVAHSMDAIVISKFSFKIISKRSMNSKRCSISSGATYSTGFVSGTLYIVYVHYHYWCINM